MLYFYHFHKEKYLFNIYIYILLRNNICILLLGVNLLKKYWNDNLFNFIPENDNDSILSILSNWFEIYLIPLSLIILLSNIYIYINIQSILITFNLWTTFIAYEKYKIPLSLILFLPIYNSLNSGIENK